MKDAYRWLAPVYSRLSRLVFGNTLQEANQWFLAPGLEYFYVIFGGGDGESYRKWAEQLRGEFWEKSPAMLNLAKKNLAGSALKFRLGEFDLSEKADFILLPFVLDTWSDAEIEAWVNRLKGHLKPQGKVVLSDFFPPSNFLQKAVLSVMIFFFRRFAAHTRKDLPDYGYFFEKASFRKRDEKVWKNGWIRAQVWIMD